MKFEKVVKELESFKDTFCFYCEHAIGSGNIVSIERSDLSLGQLRAKYPAIFSGLIYYLNENEREIKEYVQKYLEQTITHRYKEDEKPIKSLDEVVESINKGTFNTPLIHGYIMADFLPNDMMDKIQNPLCRFKYSCYSFDKSPWIRDTIVARLRKEVEEGFRHSISFLPLCSAETYVKVSFWMWCLNDENEYIFHMQYSDYGLPFLKAVAKKYGFDIPKGV